MKNKNLENALGTILNNLSNQNYEQSLAFYRLSLEVQQTYFKTGIGPDLILNSFWEHTENDRHPVHGDFVIPAAPLILRFINDAESGRVLPFRCPGLRSRFCTRLLEEFFDANLGLMCPRAYRTNAEMRFPLNVNLIAHCVNLGYVSEAAIRNHILQSLSYPRLSHDQARALCTLFKIAGAKFDAYVDRSSVDYCFELLSRYKWWYEGEKKQAQVNEL